MYPNTRVGMTMKTTSSSRFGAFHWWHVFVVILLSVLTGCAMLPKLEQKRLRPKYPLKAAVMVCESPANTYQTQVNSLWGSDVDIDLEVDEITRKVFRKGLRRVFDDVDCIKGGLPQKRGYDIIFQVRIVESDADSPRGTVLWGDKTRSSVSYRVDVHSQLTSASATFLAKADYTYRKGAVCVPLFIVEMFTIGIPTAYVFPLAYEGAGIRRNHTRCFTGSAKLAFNSISSKMQSSREVANIIAECIENKDGPAELIVDAKWSDDGALIPNRIIDALETSTVELEVTNRGKGTAYAVRLKTECSFAGVEFDDSVEIGDITPQQSSHARLTLSGTRKLRDGNARFVFQCLEKRGYHSDKIPRTIPTARLAPPELEISDYRINDTRTGAANGNGNGIPENGETVELITFVRNKGEGRAIGVVLSIVSITRGVETKIGEAQIGQVSPDRTERGELVFEIPRTFSGGDVRVGVKASDCRGELDATRHFVLQVGERRPVLAYSHQIRETSGNGNGVLENGEGGELLVCPINRGDMVANGVAIRVASEDVNFVRNEAEVGRLGAGAPAVSIRFEFEVPRNFDSDAIYVDIEVSQQDFSGLRRNERIPVSLSHPRLEIMHRVFDTNGDGSIQRGERFQLQVTVNNTGLLDAREVEVRISYDETALILTSGSETHSISQIAAGAHSPLSYSFEARPHTPVGQSPLYLTVTQRDFQSERKQLAVELVEGLGGGRSLSIAPVVLVVSPRDGAHVVSNTVLVSGTVADDRAVVSVDIKVNGAKVQGVRGLDVGSGNDQQVEFSADVPLALGENQITVTALDSDNISSEPRTVTVHYERERGEIWVVAIGINDYQRVGGLRYATRDAMEFAGYMRSNLGIDDQHLFELYDENATKLAIQTLLGNELCQKASAEDTVVIFFSGHGAPEASAASPDGDGLEKYILPVNADRSNLYGTAIPMDEIARIFRRLRANRVIFFADCCYSGESGGRTILQSGIRNVTMSDAFLERLSSGAGRIILTACAPSELSMESDALQHGYFTHYLLSGLRGAANSDGDDAIDIDEITIYVRREVPRGTNNRQHPVLKGHSEGRLVIGRIR